MNRVRRVLLFAVVALLTVSGCGKSDAVKAVESQISALGDETTIENASKVYAADKAYNSLDDKEKESVENKKKLDDAEKNVQALIDEEKKKLYEQLRDICVSGTTEMTHFLLAWEFVEETPDIQKMDAQSAMSVIWHLWDNYIEKISVLGIEVKDEDIIEALTYYAGDSDSYWIDGTKSKGINKDALGMTIAQDKTYAVQIAKYIYEKYNPLELSVDYKNDLAEASMKLEELSFLEGDEGYNLLKELYDKEINMYADISSAPAGGYEENVSRLKEYQEVGTRCSEFFSQP